ncbi:MAG: hypothetical protein JJU34_01995 [Lunatimonas sp.]|uniref:hypothetical protein n=1 Tax=Lunatimonas sp. TaxID=2060141 RepID=UPI00263B88EF|nr:hypothetical protein [Lunatimonas sp.]MCC5936030.1 hypothetical protein [Lunatimonas sp.]
MMQIKQIRVIVALVGLIAALVYLSYLFGWLIVPGVSWISGIVVIGSYLLGVYLQRLDT